MTHDLKFGWLSPVIGNAGSNHEAIVLYQQDHILPEALPYFDSLWIADHFYADARTDPFSRRTPSPGSGEVPRRHPVPRLGHGYRPPALTAKMAATLQVSPAGASCSASGPAGEGRIRAYGYDFPKPSVRFAQLEGSFICRLMWVRIIRPSMANTSASATPAPPRRTDAPHLRRGVRRRWDFRLSAVWPINGTRSIGVTTTGG